MTQENNAADRAQNLNGVSDETTVVSNESFAQDWLDAEEKERAEQTNVEARPRFVATLPDWTTFGATEDEGKGRGDWREIFRGAKFRTTGIALAAFGLGLLCASGSWRGEKSEGNEANVAAVGAENDADAGVASANGFGELSDDALSSIDSSTLRSVPNPSGVDFIPQGRGVEGAASENAVVSNVWENGAVGANGGEQTNGEAASTVDAGAFANLAPAQTSSPNAIAGDDSNWRRGVDFQRDLEAPADATANVDRFPTWDDLGANIPTVADILNSPTPTQNAAVAASNGGANNYDASENGFGVAQNAPVAQNWPVAQNAPVAQNWPVAQNAPVADSLNGGGNADYAAYNGNADYRQGAAANLNGGAPQFAGNSQNSGYNQTDGSENFAGWPTTAAVAAPSPAFASVAPGTSVPGSAPNVSPSAPSPAFASVAPGTSVPGSAPNVSPSAPTPAFASVAPGTSVPGSAPNVSPSAPTETPRAMVAQLPNENGAVAAPNVPVANPNLRW